MGNNEIKSMRAMKTLKAIYSTSTTLYAVKFSKTQ
ncbi:hypothetical protein T4A_10390 [Trichinella pseudospiralis]|uniref:Uncharacterized protein n=1 Tax=Trichinella pseudospiralis TaxID=6337 RepID=A0A0V1CRQ3_TRIPS|nr:hypothetical protein T4A_13831 [Trichinella pseudospiralis]KRY62715.1 hypothetical protein T4A_10390 [Trichinella pseudospiralis]